MNRNEIKGAGDSILGTVANRHSGHILFVPVLEPVVLIFEVKTLVEILLRTHGSNK